MAHGVAAALARAGQPPAGLILIDTYLTDLPDPGQAALRVLADWAPERVGVPTLLLRAQESVWAHDNWPSAHVRADVAGSHHSVLRERCEFDRGGHPGLAAQPCGGYRGIGRQRYW